MPLVCPKCFGDNELKKRIEEVRPKYPNSRCDLHPSFKGIPIAAVAEIVDPVFRVHYSPGGFGYENEQRGDPLSYCVSELTSAEDGVGNALAAALIEAEDYWPPDGEDAFYDDTQNYERQPPHFFRHGEIWNSFCENIVHNQRFFNLEAKAQIQELFEGIQYQRDKSSRSPVCLLEPGGRHGAFFRARSAESEAKIKEILSDPSTNLSPPPRRLRRAGRMNPAGVSCFYGAFDFETCIAELRPRVGSFVVGAQFRLVRPIFALDTTMFSSPMRPKSVFSNSYLDRVEQWTFMRSFRREIAKPISPDDEHLDYIPTQAVAEYLVNHHQFKRSGALARIEGIIYRSAQYPGGKNIAILGEAAEVNRSTDKIDADAALSHEADGIVDIFKRLRKGPINSALEIDGGSVRSWVVNGAKFNTSETVSIGAEVEESDF